MASQQRRQSAGPRIALSPLLRACVTALEHCIQRWAPQYKTDRHTGASPVGGTKLARGQEHMPYLKELRNCIHSGWKRKLTWRRALLSAANTSEDSGVDRDFSQRCTMMCQGAAGIRHKLEQDLIR